MLGLWVAIAIVAAPEEAEVQLTAERLLHDGKSLVTTAEGRAKLVTEGSAIDADRITYNQHTRVATAVGHVVARLTQGGKIAVVADLMTLVLDERQEVKEVYLFDGQAISKKDVSGVKLLAASTAEEVERAGTTQAILEGNHLVRDGPRWRVERLELVPCECDFKNPAWSILSYDAVIDTEADRVSVVSPVVRIKSVPIFWLPWLSLPLSDRQSGLLFPRPGYDPNLYGFALDQPVYFTLGRSADLTLSPGFFTGAPEQIVETPATPTRPATRVNNGTPIGGVAGPRMGVEFRYAPAKTASGRINLGVLYDFKPIRDVANAGLFLPDSQRGLRGELSWQHTHDFGPGFGARADVNAYSDGYYNRDLTVDVIASASTYLRSTVSLFHRGETHWVGLDATVRQDIRLGYDWLGRGARIDGTTKTLDETPFAPFGPGTIQRWPGLSFGWTPSRTLGPVRFELEGDAVRLAPLFSNTGDEGEQAMGGATLAESFVSGGNRLFVASNAAPNADQLFPGVGDRQWQPGEREARDRLMLLPKVSISGQLFDALSASAFVAWRQLAWFGEASGQSWTRGYLLVGGRLETEVSRRFGELRHVIQPLAELRGVVGGFDGANGAPVAYDAVDAAVPNLRPRYQGVIELRQRLTRGGAELLRLDVGQGFELNRDNAEQFLPTLGELSGRLGTRIGFFGLQGLVRLDPLPQRLRAGCDPVTTDCTVEGGGFTRLAGRVDLDDGKRGAWASFERIMIEGSMRSRQPLDLLFLVDRGFTSATWANQVTFGGRWDFGPVMISYTALVGDGFDSVAMKPVLLFSQHMLTLGVAPACDCWRIDLTAIQPVPWGVQEDGKFGAILRAPNFRFNLTISKFGSIGTR